MNLILSRPKTEAEAGLAAQFEALGGLNAARRAAFAQFAEAGLPNKRVEAWHFTDLRGAMDTALPLAGDAAGPVGKPESLMPGACVIALVDGRYSPAHSDDLPAHVALCTDTGPMATKDSVLALNHAFAAHPLHLEIAAGCAVDQPIHIAHLISQGQPKALFARVAVTVGAGAQVCLVESASGMAGPHQINLALELTLGADAKCSHIADFAAANSVLVNSLSARLGGQADLHSFAMLSGGALLRRQMFVALEGEGGNVTLNGVQLGRGEEHIDTSLVVAHMAGHGVSRETFRTILDGEATGVYQGKVVVHPHAQKTDGKMMSKAVLLSDHAVMDNKPELEIFADDVVCGHGATVGALDEDQIFYCAARGIAKPEAEGLLLQAFADELIEALPDAAAIPHMSQRVADWLRTRKDVAQ
ncbi:MAG: SufD family Fe-S cluster assembly protein [Hyphomicrobiales bacterium]|nr:SufD family Fe-S cluster assembly protein [Hyphomicrobiales bacterium]MDE2115090.1 SufD family Fe-S cluster assembly protein [Hyphomicrobiales bacterium]